MKKIMIFSIFFLIFTSFMSLNAQWVKFYRGILFGPFQQTNDGGYIFAGETWNEGNSSDIWVSKLDSNGDIEWQKSYGGWSYEYAYSIQQTSDGGFIVAGNTDFYNDMWILKLASNGDIEWQRAYGGGEDGFHEGANSIIQTSDGGYIVAGGTNSFGDGSTGAWILKLDSYGDIEWQRTYRGDAVTSARSIQQTSDGGYIIGGGRSEGGSIFDYWVLKLDSYGDIEWQRIYGFGGNAPAEARSLQRTSDGGYIIAGNIWSYDQGHYDVWLLKLASNGDIEWQRAYGGNEDEHASSIQQTSDGGFVLAGSTHSFGNGFLNGWVLKLDLYGDIEWQRLIGVNGDEFSESAGSILQTIDGSYIVAGKSWDYNAYEDDVGSFISKLYSDGDTYQPCELVRSANASITETSASAVDTNVTPQDTNVSPRDTNVTPRNADATVHTVCGEDREYILTINKCSGSGFTDPISGRYFHESGTQVMITAIPEGMYIGFWGWSGDVTGTDNPIRITMDSHKNVKAIFIQQEELIIVARPGGTTNPPPGTYKYDIEASVSIRAIPNSGYKFIGWSGDVSEETNPITITMDTSKEIIANFKNGLFKSSCYIATAAYDSTDHPYVKILQDFRDKYLMSNKFGRFLVNLYYRYSPFIANIISKNKALKLLFQVNLIPAIAFSYSMVNIGPIMTAVYFFSIFVLPIFLLSSFCWNLRRTKALSTKGSGSFK
jgi:hypothetical protein